LTGAGNSMDAQYILGDDVSGLLPHYDDPKYFGSADTRRQNLFQWKGDVYLPDQQIFEISGFYKRIYTANKIINEVMGTVDGRKEQKQKIQAEAYCQRAFAYFMLINYFGKPYSSETSISDLGVPIILEPNFSSTNFQRATVSAVYKQIINDLLAAIPNLPLIQNSANRFCKSAGEALLGKVFLFSKEFQLAKEQLDSAVSHLPTYFTTGGTVGFINYNTASPGNPLLGYVFVTPQVGSTASQGNGYPETLNAQVGIATWLGNSSPLVISPETYALFDEKDLRRKLYVRNYSPLAPGNAAVLPTGLFRSRAGFLGSSVGIQLPDLYLLRAEAKARVGDVSGAKESLFIVRKNRMPVDIAFDSIPDQQVPLIKFIMDERRREFATLGFRWFDMKRLSNDPLFLGVNYQHILYSSSGEIIATYNLNPERFQLRFSDKLLNISQGLEDNP
ncbi:MAG: RagB/SusD family nutrient uptake outer membrane protein, partial [Chitinophagaceae bacterium]|nr:RagB/SusD family nutrient uptake outer membrane protein [Chitinophagaceae bacterium]